MSFFRKLVFNYWYFRKPPWDTNQTPPEVLEFIQNNPPGKALDLGCGTGTNAITLARNGWQVVGVDYVGKAIRAAKKKGDQAQVKIEFRVADVTKLTGVEGPYDLVLDIGCYHNLSTTGKADYRKTVNHLLKVEGIFMLYAFFRNGETTPGPGVVEAELNSFSAILELVSRVDVMERGAHPSVWLTFQKRETQP